MMRTLLTYRLIGASADVTPAEHVIDKFGGLTPLARALDCAVSTVQGWKERGKIPQDHWHAIVAAGSVRSIDLSLDDFVFPQKFLTAKRFDAIAAASGARITDAPDAPNAPTSEVAE